jgi:hypothetical protein
MKLKLAQKKKLVEDLKQLLLRHDAKGIVAIATCLISIPVKIPDDINAALFAAIFERLDEIQEYMKNKEPENVEAINTMAKLMDQYKQDVKKYL